MLGVCGYYLSADGTLGAFEQVAFFRGTISIAGKQIGSSHFVNGVSTGNPPLASCIKTNIPSLLSG